jgi:hypothetical protein
MRRLFLFTLAIYAIAPAKLALATDCSVTPTSGWYSMSYPLPQNLSTSAHDCWYQDSGIAFEGMTCYYGSSGYVFNGVSSVTYFDFTIGANDSGTSTFTLAFDADFVHATNSIYDNLSANVIVTHNSISTYYTIYSRLGTQSGNDECAHPWGYFYAQNGDTVRIQFQGGRGSTDSHIRVSYVRVDRYFF